MPSRAAQPPLLYQHVHAEQEQFKVCIRRYHGRCQRRGAYALTPSLAPSLPTPGSIRYVEGGGLVSRVKAKLEKVRPIVAVARTPLEGGKVALQH